MTFEEFVDKAQRTWAQHMQTQWTPSEKQLNKWIDEGFHPTLIMFAFKQTAESIHKRFGNPINRYEMPRVYQYLSACMRNLQEAEELSVPTPEEWLPKNQIIEVSDETELAKATAAYDNL